MKQYAKKIIIIVLVFFTSSLIAQTNNELVRDFVKGNISEKIQLIEAIESADETQIQLIEEAFDFVINSYDLLSDDDDFISLTRFVIQASNTNTFDSMLPKLKILFEVAEVPAIKLDLLTVFSSITVNNDEIISMINNYAQLLLSNEVSADRNILFLTLEVLGNFASATSFPILFQTYAYSEDSELSEVAFNALIKLNTGYENYVRDLIETGTPREKYYTLQLVQKNSKNSDFFKAEMSEKALFSTIINIGDVSNVDAYTVELQMSAIRELVRISWTRSEDLVTDFYLIAKTEFEAGVLSEDNFSEIIHAFTALSSSNAGAYLSEFLEELNKRKEENMAYSESVVLTVIQSLGLLGDKVAFDALLYTTYLDYPENIILAARDALVTLKW